MSIKLSHIIVPETVGTLSGLFRERVQRTPDTPAYRHFDPATEQWQETTWAEMAAEMVHWRSALLGEELGPGDRVGLMLRNSREWVLFEQAALSLGLVVVPLYTNDRPDNVRFILKNAGVKLLLLEGYPQWEQIKQGRALPQLTRIISLNPFAERDELKQLSYLEDWLSKTTEDCNEYYEPSSPDSLATVIYTSGTTGLPKGVMLSHHNILWNAYGGLLSTPTYPEDLFLSFLPLSHAFERTVGYYLPMMAGATVAYARSISTLGEDLKTVKPTILTSVPRIFERILNQLHDELQERTSFERALFRLAVTVGWRFFNYRQGKASWHPLCLLAPLLQRIVGHQVLEQLGGHLRVVVCGGAPLAYDVSQELLAFGLPITQGYGLTEASPIVSTNSLVDNNPKSVGLPLPGAEVRIGEHNELLVRSPGIMLGYWNNPKATSEVIDPEGWLHTGDQARLEQGHIFITGRIKEIIVLANGEKVPPGEMEAAIAADSLFDQVLVIGEGKPYLSALVVLNPEHWAELAHSLKLDPQKKESLKDPHVIEYVLQQIGKHIQQFPGYARIHQVALILEHWTTENGLATATLKARRQRVIQHYRAEINALYEGH